MAEEKTFFDETLPVVTYTAAPFSVLGLFRSSRRLDRRRGVPHTAHARVLVTDKRIVVDKKTFILANVATVTEHDDEAEVAAFNEKYAVETEEPRYVVITIFLLFGLPCGIATLHEIWEAGLGNIHPKFTKYTVNIVALMIFGWITGRLRVVCGKSLTPDYTVVIESAGTRDNALVCKDRMVVQRIVRAISDALVAR